MDMAWNSLICLALLLATFGGCLGDKPDAVGPLTPTHGSTPTVNMTVRPSAPPHDLGFMQLPAGESAGYVRLSTKGFDEGIRTTIRASTLAGERFFFAAVTEAGAVVWADEAERHQFFHGADVDELVIRFYARAESKVYVTINNTYIPHQGPLELQRVTTTFESTPFVQPEFQVDVDGDTVAAELGGDTGEYVLRDPEGTERASWPASPYTLTALRGEWTLQAGMVAVGPIDVVLVKLPTAPSMAAG